MEELIRICNKDELIGIYGVRQQWSRPRDKGPRNKPVQRYQPQSRRCQKASSLCCPLWWCFFPQQFTRYGIFSSVFLRGCFVTQRVKSVDNKRCSLIGKVTLLKDIERYSVAVVTFRRIPSAGHLTNVQLDQMRRTLVQA